MGFKGILTEGAKHVLGWKSPHYVYHCAYNPNLKILLRDFKLSDDISLRFSNSDWSEYPLFADKYIGWIAGLPEEEHHSMIRGISVLPPALRMASSMVPLPVFSSTPIAGLTLGCVLVNTLGVFTKANILGPLDVLFGSAATLLAAFLTHQLRGVRIKGCLLYTSPSPRD